MFILSYQAVSKEVEQITHVDVKFVLLHFFLPIMSEDSTEFSESHSKYNFNVFDLLEESQETSFHDSEPSFLLEKTPFPVTKRKKQKKLPTTDNSPIPSKSLTKQINSSTDFPINLSLLAGCPTSTASLFFNTPKRICLLGISSVETPSGRIITLSPDAESSFSTASIAHDVAASSNDPQSFILACNQFPFYPNLLFDTAKLLIRYSKPSMAHDYIRRCLASLEPVFRPYIGQNSTHFDPDDEYVSIFLDSLLHHVRFLFRQGKVKSAVESIKLSLKIDPTDTYGFLLHLDELLVRGGPSCCLFLVEFLSKYSNISSLSYLPSHPPCLSILPTFAFSLPLALLEIDSPDASDGLLQAMLLFPEFLFLLFELLNINSVEGLSNSKFFHQYFDQFNSLPAGSDTVFYMYLVLERYKPYWSKHLQLIIRTANTINDMYCNNLDLIKRAQNYREIHLPGVLNYFESHQIKDFIGDFLQEDDKVYNRIKQKINERNRNKLVKVFAENPIILFFKSLLPWFAKIEEVPQDYR
ncbi:hypothetical protein RCL1_003707 [Eukaryota sp. TZLM3-RCL]